MFSEMSALRAIRRPALAMLALAVASISFADGFKTAPASTAARLKADFKARTKTGCESIAPIQTELRFGSNPKLGVATPLALNVLTFETGPAAEVFFDIPKGITLRSGNGKATGRFEANRAYQFSVTVTIDQPGSYEVSASAICGEPSYRFGRRDKLYIEATTTTVKVSDRPFNEPTPTRTAPPPTQGGILSSPPTARFAPPTTEPFTDVTDPKGRPLDEVKQQGTSDVSTTVTGTWRYRHDDGTLHGGYGSTVYAWDADTFSADDFLDSANVNPDASFSLTFDNATDDFLEGGTADVYLEFRTSNSVCRVHTNASNTAYYTTSTAVIFTNISGGTHSAGGWFADWGTNGVADGNERAFEMIDHVTSGWEHTYYDEGETGIHFTYCMWYVGYSGGSFYDDGTNTLHIDEEDFSSVDVVLHEFGHNAMDYLYGEADWPPGAGGAHSWTGHSGNNISWTEGWATWFSCTSQGDDNWYDSYDPSNLQHIDCDANYDGNGAANGNSDNLSNSPNWGYDTESAVCTFLIDLDDSRNSTTDPFDWTTLGDNEIWDVTKNYNPSGHNIYYITEFYNGWTARGWDYHPQLNGQMMTHGMKQPINKPALGIYDGVDIYTGTWYYGGYGRGSYTVKNYGSQDYDLNRLYVWLRGPANEDIGQFGSDNDGTPIPSGGTRLIYLTEDQIGYNPAAPNFIYGTYSITAGHYRSDNVWQTLEPAEAGTATIVYKSVIEDTDGPTSCTVVDDGDCQNSASQLHIVANAVENDSTIKSYWTRVGTAAGLGNEQDWVEHPANNQNTFDYTITGLSMAANTVYYVTVVARNIEGHDSPFAYTDGIIALDATPPGAVTVTDGGVATSSLTQLHVHATSSETDGCIASYWTRVGTSPGLGDERDWVQHVTGDVDVFDMDLTGLSMVNGTTYYITVVARNMSNLDTFGYSDGILVTDRILPTSISYVRGSTQSGGLADIQTSNDVRLISKPGAVFSNAEFPCQLVVNGTSLIAGGSLTSLTFQVEGQVSANNTRRKVELWDWTANAGVGAYVQVGDEVFASGADSVRNYPAPGAIPNFVQVGTGAVRAKISWRMNSAVFVWPPVFRTDMAVWLVGYP